MKKIIIKYAAFVLLLCSTCMMSSCKDDEGHKAGSPVIVNRFYPTSGSAGTEILITGKNFTTDVEKVSVMLGNTSLKVLNCDMNNILVIVPAKLGEGPLTVSINGREPVTTLDKFTYAFSAVVTTFAGNGEAGYQDGFGSEAMFQLNDAEGWRRGSICVDNDGNVYVGDASNFCLRKITPDGTVSTLAGYAGSNDKQDGTGLQARFTSFYGMDTDNDGNIYLTDVHNYCIRKVTPDGVVSTLGNTSFEPWSLTVDKRNGDIYVSNKGGGIYQWTAQGETKISSAQTLDIVLDAEGNLYAADQSVNGIVKYAAGTWEATTLVGNGTAAYVDGPFKEARFAYPSGLAIDANGDIYVAGNGSWNGGENPDQSIRQLNMKNKIVRTIAGSSLAGYNDANASSATFSGPIDVAVGKDGLIYVYDKINNVVRKIVYK